MFERLRRWRRRRLLRRVRLPDDAWEQAVDVLEPLDGLDPAALERLRDLATVFSVEKVIEPVSGLQLTPDMEVLIAAQACLPILNLGLDHYHDFTSIVLYPEGFLSQHEHTDDAGLVHRVRRPLIGEAWEHGPVVLSWEDIVEGLDEPGLNVVIHEMAHKLDMLTGEADGLPPLPRGMSEAAWSQVFTAAFEELGRKADRGRRTPIDPYAAESPGEFFAVVSEAFFETPEIVLEAYPEVYAQLRGFYRQDPAERQGFIAPPSPSREP